MEALSELKAAGIELFGEIGAWTYDEWARLNQNFFKGKNQPGPVYWVSVTDNRSLGCYLFSENIIYLHKGLVRPRYPTNMYRWCLKNLNQPLASDVLLHEMIHQTIHQTGGWQGKSSHNNNRFVDEVNRIAKLLGLNVIAKVIRKEISRRKPTPNDDPGSMPLKELSNFPYSSRPYEYYYRPE